MFEPFIVHVSDDLIRNDSRLEDFSAGEHFATRYIEPFETIAAYENQGKQIIPELIGNIRMVPDFIIYDKYIENYDRHDNNVCLLPNNNLTNKMDYYLFDHDLAFQRIPNTSRNIINLRDMQKKKIDKMVFLVSCITKLRFFDKIINRIESMIHEIPNIIKNIPSTWSSRNREYVNSIEILLTKFTKDIANNHIFLNKDKLPFMK